MGSHPLAAVTRIAPGDPGYPPALAPVPDPPPLDVWGELRREDALAVAVVGSRQPTPYGIRVAEGLGRDLAARGITVVSGVLMKVFNQ